MSVIASIFLGLMIGILLGLFFYGGLWLTLKYSIRDNKHYLLSLSFLVRTIILMFCLYQLVSFSHYVFGGVMVSFMFSKWLATSKVQSRNIL